MPPLPSLLPISRQPGSADDPIRIVELAPPTWSVVEGAVVVPTARVPAIILLPAPVVDNTPLLITTVLTPCEPEVVVNVPDAPLADPHDEIGRASCRERV